MRVNFSIAKKEMGSRFVKAEEFLYFPIYSILF